MHTTPRLTFALATMARALESATARRARRVVLNRTDVAELLAALEEGSTHENDNTERRPADIGAESAEPVGLHHHGHGAADPDSGTRRGVHGRRGHRSSGARVLVDTGATIARIAAHH